MPSTIAELSLPESVSAVTVAVCLGLVGQRTAAEEGDFHGYAIDGHRDIAKVRCPDGVYEKTSG